MARRKKVYEGKAKILYEGPEPGTLIQHFKDDATAFNALKKAQLAGKGELNCRISALLFEHLAARGIPTHYLGVEGSRWMLARPVRVIPIEVVIRNVAAGSLCKQMPIAPGTPLEPPLLDLYYKDDGFGDPLLTEARLEHLGLVTPEQRRQLEELARQVNRELLDQAARKVLAVLAASVTFARCLMWFCSLKFGLSEQAYKGRSC